MKWEYRSYSEGEKAPQQLQETLNTWGSQGWELAFYETYNLTESNEEVTGILSKDLLTKAQKFKCVRYIFKRPLHDNTEEVERVFNMDGTTTRITSRSNNESNLLQESRYKPQVTFKDQKIEETEDGGLIHSITAQITGDLAKKIDNMVDGENLLQELKEAVGEYRTNRWGGSEVSYEVTLLKRIDDLISKHSSDKQV